MRFRWIIRGGSFVWLRVKRTLARVRKLTVDKGPKVARATVRIGRVVLSKTVLVLKIVWKVATRATVWSWRRAKGNKGVAGVILATALVLVGIVVVLMYSVSILGTLFDRKQDKTSLSAQMMSMVLDEIWSHSALIFLAFLALVAGSLFYVMFKLILKVRDEVSSGKPETTLGGPTPSPGGKTTRSKLELSKPAKEFRIAALATIITCAAMLALFYFGVRSAWQWLWIENTWLCFAIPIILIVCEGLYIIGNRLVKILAVGLVTFLFILILNLGGGVTEIKEWNEARAATKAVPTRWMFDYTLPPDVEGAKRDPEVLPPYPAVILRYDESVFAYRFFYPERFDTEESNFYWDRIENPDFGEWSQVNPPESGRWYLHPDPTDPYRFVGAYDSKKRPGMWIPMSLSPVRDR